MILTHIEPGTCSTVTLIVVVLVIEFSVYVIVTTALSAYLQTADIKLPELVLLLELLGNYYSTDKGQLFGLLSNEG